MFAASTPQTPKKKKSPNSATAFGSPFGMTATTTSAGFGFGSSFGAPAQSAPAFGTAAQPTQAFGAPSQPAPSFGAPNQPAPSFGGFGGTTQPAFGTSFGGTPTSSAPPFGSTFGTPTTSTGFASGFGTSSLFGSGNATTKPSLFGTTSTPSLFSNTTTTPSLFGTSTTTQAPSLFGSTVTSTPSLFGTGNAAPTPGLFGSTTQPTGLFGNTFGTATTTAPSLFGGSTGGFGMFGSTQTTTSAPLFGSFGSNTQTTSVFNGFGAGGGTGMFNLGAKPAAVAPQQPTQHQQYQQILASIYAINIFGDERDDILKKWNLLQACWGTGKGYYNPNQPPVDYTPQNPYYRFKAISYNIIPQHDNSEGIVKLIFNKKYAELIGQKEVLVNGISGILGNKPNLKVIIHNIKALTDNQAEVRIIVTEKGVTGTTRKIPATDLAAFFNQPAQKQQLGSVGVAAIVALVKPSKATLEEYLRNVPSGFDPQMWKAAIADNPNSEKYMPVPIYGFNDLKSRKLKQEHEVGLHKAYEEKIRNDLVELKKKQASSLAKITELKHRFLHLQHRTLKILVKQESIRKSGIALMPEEEYLKGKLESAYAQLSIPTQFRGQLNELVSTVKLMDSTPRPAQPRYKLLPESQCELKEFLQLQQNGITKLVNIVKEDLKALNIITEGMRTIQVKRIQ